MDETAYRAAAMRLWEYVAAGHLPWLDDPAAVASATATFLATGTQQVLAA